MDAAPAEISTEPQTPAGAACAACGQPLAGRFCFACGERRLEPREQTVRHFVTHALVPELISLDGKIWRTLRLLLLRPGYLALEYAAGRRARYVKPLRVLLTAIIVYTLATLSGTGFTLNFGPLSLSVAPQPQPANASLEGTLFRVDRFGLLERLFEEKFGPLDDAPEDVEARFGDMVGNFATPMSFTTVVLLAVVLYALFRRRRPLFVEHAVFAMHYYSFVLLASLIDLLAVKLDLVFGAVLLVMLAVHLWQVGYLVVGLQRFYWCSARRRWVTWTKAVAAAMLLFLLNALFITGVQLLGGAIAIWRL